MSEGQPGIETRRMLAALEQKLFASEPEPVRIGRFVIVDRLGAGGMGTVYRAYDPDLDRRVAVKVLRAETGAASEVATARLLREAKTMARLNHPHVVTVHEVGMFEDRVFVAMEYVDGGTLADWMKQHEAGTRHRVEGAIDLAVQAARGLTAAHSASVVHRDLKPANILIDANGRLRIADFGLASSRSSGSSAREPASDSVPSGRSDDSLTETGDVVGTPAYMAPEQIAGEADERSDQFSYCASFFEAAYGTSSHPGRTIAERMLSITEGKVVEPAGAAVPAWLRAVFLRGLAVRPEDRHRDMGALLEEIEKHRRPRARRAIYGGAAATVVVGAAAIYVASRDDVRCGDGEARLADAWSSTRRDDVARAFAASELAYADAAATRVTQTLDAYALSWSAAYEDACTATWERGEQSPEMLDLRMLCLERGKAALGFVADTLAAGGDDVARASVDLAQKLPDVAACSDRDGLQRRRDRAHSPEQQAASDEALRTLDRVRAVGDIGRFADAEAMLAELATQAEALELVDISARVAAHETQLMMQQGRFDDAAARSDAALRAAEADTDGDAAVFAHVMRARVDMHATKLDAAAHQLDLAEAALRRGDSARVREAELALVRGELLNLQGKLEQAITSFDRAYALFVETRGPDATILSSVVSGKAHAMVTSGRLDESLALHVEAAAIIARAYGPDHPEQAAALYRAGFVHSQRGETEKALELHLRAHALLDADPAYKPQQRYRIALAVADAYGQLAQYDDAKAWLARAEAIGKKVYGPDHPETAMVDFSRGSMALDTLDFAAAAELFRSVLERWAGVQARDYDSAMARLNLAVAESRAGQHDLAVESAAAARKQIERFVDPKGQQMIGYLSSLGDVYRLGGRAQQAADAYEVALEISAAHDGSGFKIDEVRFGLARILFERGDRARAVELAEVARANLVAGGEGKASILRELDAWRREHGLAE